MSKRAILYARVSTDEQAEKGYSLQSQLEALREYAARNGFDVVSEIKDDYSGAKLDRPGLDMVRAMIDRREVDAVIVFSPDRLTRNLAHSLVLREEWQRANIELHYCNRGKSENTPEGQMTANIEAVFGDYWRAKIIESSSRGRRTKAANGKWPCDGHPAYGYRQEGKAREAHLVIDEAEAHIVRRIFAMYAGVWGQPISLHGIAAALNGEGIAPPNRGGAKGKGKKGMGWHRGTIRNILRRRAYIGEFHYSGHVINAPDLALLPKEIFEAAQKRSEKSRAIAASYPRRLQHLLTGHIKCSCNMGMSGTHARERLYYVCNAELNHPYMRKCTEKMLRQDIVDPVVWDWVTGLLCDEEKLNAGLRAWSNRSETELEPKRERLSLIEKLVTDAEGKIKRLTAAFADEQDETISVAIRGQMREAGRERTALVAERDGLRAELTQSELSPTDVEAIKYVAADIRRKLSDPTLEQRRALLNLLDVQVKLAWKDDERCVIVSCGLTVTLTPNEKPSADLIGEWLRLVVSRVESSSTTTM